MLARTESVSARQSANIRSGPSRTSAPSGLCALRMPVPADMRTDSALALPYVGCSPLSIVNANKYMQKCRFSEIVDKAAS